jgi:hypothetical protein
MSTGALDPLIHDPERLRIIATLAALSDGDALSVTRLQDLIGLTPDSPITGLRELDHAGYVRTGKTGNDRAQTTVARPGWPGTIIRHQHPMSALAMLTGRPLPRPWVSTSCRAG